MALSRRVLARSIAAQLLSGAATSDIVPKLAAYIVDNRLQMHVDAIIGDIAYELARQGAVEATVTTARPLTDDLRALVYRYIERHETGASIQLSEIVDPSIVGGVIIETPASRYDASVTQYVQKLKTT